MTKTMRLELHFSGGVHIEKDITYQGDSYKEIAKLIDTDNNNLLEYMQTGDFKGAKSFCFGGFMFKKAGIIAAQISELLDMG